MALKGITDKEAKNLYNYAQKILEITEKAQQNFTRQWEINSFRDTLLFNERKKEIPAQYYKFKLEEFEIWIEKFENLTYRVYEKKEAEVGKPHYIKNEEYANFENAKTAFYRLVKGTIEEKENGLC